MKKYQVNSSEVLELRYEHYLDAQQQQRNYDHIHRSMRNLSHDIEDVINKLQIEDIEFDKQNAEYFATAKGLERLYEKHQRKKSNITKRFAKTRT